MANTSLVYFINLCCAVVTITRILYLTNYPQMHRGIPSPPATRRQTATQHTPWENRVPPSAYGSARPHSALLESTPHDDAELPLYKDTNMELKRRFEEKQPVHLEEPVVDDDQGKWGKGYGAGPGIGGRRGLPPKQRIPGWVRPFVLFFAYPDTAQKGIVLENEEWVWAAVYTLLSMITRFWRIGAANYVVWDEAHFGKFGTHYINRDFYFDVHPPLGKMLVGLAGLLSGYQGNFEFKSGVAYPEDVPYTAMRVMLASFGVALVPLAWFTSGEMGWSRWTRHWVTICVLCGESHHPSFSSYGPC